MSKKKTKKPLKTIDIVNLLKKQGYEILEDTKRGLYIAFDRNQLVYNSGDLINTSIKDLKSLYGGNPEEKEEGANCKNKEALQRIEKLEKVINFIIDNPKGKEIFDYIPYTKEGKFPMNGSINLYIPNIKNTWSGEYFSQTEVSLQLRTTDNLSLYWLYSQDVKTNEIMILEINRNASFTNKKTPENIIDEDLNFHKIETKRNSYLKQDELIPGTSYTDAKGSEYLYIGKVFVKYHGYTTSRKEDTPPTYIRVTSKLKKELEKYSNLQDYLKERFSKNVKDKFNSRYYDTDITSGLNQTFSKKFVSENTVYYDNCHNKLEKMTIKKQRYYDLSLLSQGEDAYMTITIDFI